MRLDFQPAECLDQETVERYAEAPRHGEDVPPLRVCHDGRCYGLADGFLRLRAARMARRRNIKAEIVRATYADMQVCCQAAEQAIHTCQLHGANSFDYLTELAHK